MKAKKNIVVVGAGLFGLTIAERCAKLGVNVQILEKREHIGGNTYSYFDDQTGINVHKYGSHIFHTSNENVWQYVNRFAKFNRYEHKVLALFEDNYYPIPVNLLTMSNFFKKALTPMQAEILVKEKAAPFQAGEAPTNLQEKGLQTLGQELFEAFFGNYTEKQWQTPAEKLPAETIGRIPVRYDFESRYFTDKYQGIPINGYTPLCENMIESPLIEMNLGVDFFSVRAEIPKDALVIYTGPIDQYFDYRYGRLKWRTIDFEFEHYNCEDYQGTAVVNYPEKNYPYTRIHEFKHLHPESSGNTRGTVIAKEFSRFAQDLDEPYYPINTAEDRTILQEYRNAVRENESHLIVGGRLGSYQYLDMHMAIASALAMFENRIRPMLEG